MRTIISFLLPLLSAAIFSFSDENSFPKDHLALTQPISYESMVSLLDEISDFDHVTVTREGNSAEGRELFLVRISSHPASNHWRIFLYGAQHGDEPAGKDALLYLIRRFAHNPQDLPENVELWVMPMVNPDGVALGQRRNGNGADLNRDHTRLSQPETRTLHRVVRRIMPHVAVDCHEFGRDSADYGERGWLEWPQIMMDTANHPLFDDRIYEAGLRWIHDVGEVLGAAGYNFSRYSVGDAPPAGELRYSTLDTDDGRNGIGAYGGLSFIIESGVQRGAADPDADVGLRVDAYLRIFDELIFDDTHRENELAVIADIRAKNRPSEFIPINYFWGNVAQVITPVKVIEKSTGRELEIMTPNFMHQRVVKKSVGAPGMYAIPASNAEKFADLLSHHGIEYSTISLPLSLRIEACILESVSEAYDELYSRYGGLQSVVRKSPETRELSPGSLLVPLGGTTGLRAALLLEPTLLYGLYQFDEFRALVGDDGELPVLRVVDASQ